ncbi:dimethylaniline monooxygenase [Rhizodiscina lignyota]|uniref:Dimethylaniline monooxygenase n=1 Tax=Rhizodiscina lignyota TaxID=1504668 RepID=A0A9P4IAG6_9PEZI|nr:dimethylaniline monooxygenase [Rhizodiscina lignyota]
MVRRKVRVAVIGAGVSGVLAAAYLKAAGIDVEIYERSSEAGGVWVFDERRPIEPLYPAIRASRGEDYPSHTSPELEHAPPSPCYFGLKNNVATRLMRTKLSAWPPGTEDYVSHHMLKDYIQTIAKQEGLDQFTNYGARVTDLRKTNGLWDLTYIKLRRDSVIGTRPEEKKQTGFDSVIVASGHYHAPRVPDILGLKESKRRWPDRIWHSKGYRSPKQFQGKNVLLVGAGTSSIDIARELGPVANKVYQSSRDGFFEFPATMLPANGIRVCEIAACQISSEDLDDDQHEPLMDTENLPLTILLVDGRKICNIHTILLCTGYHITLPFLQQYHDDDIPAAKANETVLVTDGTQLHNLHKDIFYIPDPSLIFIGVPYFSATFTLFEYQAIAVAAVLSEKATLPPKEAMRQEYQERLQKKGSGKRFHSIRGEEVQYVAELLEWINNDMVQRGFEEVQGHSAEWHEAKKEQIALMQKLFAGNGDVANGSVELSVLNCTD